MAGSVTAPEAAEGRGTRAAQRAASPAHKRIALLVHNTFESDPRVNRHAQAALRAGYRVAALCVVPPSPGQVREPRWGRDSAGALASRAAYWGVRCSAGCGRVSRGCGV